ncbi:hypothetical protein LSAT2_023318 [Lamellibrachia satsuma]|nr:hypothetical protein LSAT2_023318 [Lamellibrachia satsuma]
MFLSHQTFEGLQITVKSVVEATKYLLCHGVDYVLTQIFCQDPLEEHFSRHRALGRRSDNPTLWGFGYQENKLRLQRTLAMQMKPRGNIREKRKRQPIKMSDSPLKKRKR